MPRVSRNYSTETLKKIALVILYMFKIQENVSMFIWRDDETYRLIIEFPLRHGLRTTVLLKIFMSPE